jgi:hypothetical protein
MEFGLENNGMPFGKRIALGTPKALNIVTLAC